MQALCVRFSQQCPVYTVGHARSSSLQRNFAPQTIQAFNRPPFPHGFQAPFTHPPSPPALPFDPQFAVQLELTKTRKDLAENQQNLQDVIKQLEDERAKSSSTTAEVVRLQQQLTFEGEQKQRVEQNLEEITSRLLLAKEEVENEKAEKEALKLTLDSTVSELNQANGRILQLKTRKEELQQTLGSTMSELGQVREKIQYLNAQKEDLQQKLNAAVLELATTIARLSQAKAESKLLAEEYETKLADTSNRLKQTEDELEKSLRDSQQLKMKISQTETPQKTHARSDMEQLEMQLKSSQEDAKEAKEKLEMNKTKLDELLNSFMAQISHTTELENQKQEQERQLEEAQKKIRELESCIHSGEPQVYSKDVVSSEEVKLFRDKLLGTGAWGFVVEGRFRGKAVAIKCLHQEILSQFTVGQIQREISIMADLRHPNLVLFIAAIMDGDSSPMIITELLSITLRRAYNEDKIAETNKLPIFHDLASALNYLHLQHKPIIHRDVSSANVLLEKMANDVWKAKLSDFGSANLVRFATTPGEGTLIYAAPEMRINAHNPQAPSVDVYSYGVLVCEVTTSTFPVHTSFTDLMQLLQSEWPDMYHITEQCTQEIPDKRPTMQDIISQLDKLTTEDN